MSHAEAMTGHVVGCQVWKRFAEAPRDGRPIRVMRADHSIGYAHYRHGAWRRGYGWLPWWTRKLDLDHPSPVTHYA